ncbi:hypothetical protein KY284_031021 [Solanum tuberosum]|nr:hypothetical protein KY284_031021 [Solanum tuberosum]
METEDSLRDQLRQLKESGACYVQLRRSDQGLLSWRCLPCIETFTNVTDFEHHLNSDVHINLQNFPCNTLLKANRWPFYDSLIFGLGISNDLEVKNVLCYGDMGDMKLDFIGNSLIFRKLSEDESGIHKMWAEWRDKSYPTMQDVPLHDLSLINFKCNLTLGMSASTFKELQQISLYDLYHRSCKLCDCPIPPGCDVSTILNNGSSMLSCSYHNTKGMYHLFHTSCLLNWMLMMEELSQGGPIIQQRRKQKISPKHLAKFQDYHFCPECCCTDDDENFVLWVFRLRDLIVEGRMKWRTCYEHLENSSIGLSFRSAGHQSHATAQGNGSVKLLRIYQGYA